MPTATDKLLNEKFGVVSSEILIRKVKESPEEYFQKGLEISKEDYLQELTELFERLNKRSKAYETAKRIAEKSSADTYSINQVLGELEKDLDRDRAAVVFNVGMFSKLK